MSKTVIVELCQRQSLGSRFREPRVIEWCFVDEAEAARRIALALPNDYYWRRQPEDMTGAIAQKETGR